MSNNNKSANPYAKAAGTYGTHSQQHTNDPRELEARVLLKAAQNFVNLQNDWADISAEQLDNALIYNRQIWMMFVDTAMNDSAVERPRDLRSNIANLGSFVFKHSQAVLLNPAKEKLNILIEINRDVAAGLMSRPSTDKAGDAAAPPAKSQHQQQI